MMTAHTLEDLAVALPGAVERGELVAYFQPQIDLETSRVVAAEALARWNHPEFGLIGPAEFIPLAEGSGLVAGIGTFMLQQACRQVAAWHAAGFDVEVAVNVSILELGVDYSDELLAVLSECGTDPSWITLEITETRAIDDLDGMTASLSKAKESGVAVSIDDFGIGHSTIDRARRLEADELKIDRSYIQGDDELLNEVRDVLEEAHAAGVRLVAEGIETEEHLRRAKELGCERGQGFLLGPPVSAEELLELLA
jgi:EAL domain-containing protein (putative c-di-GMP-specific phosphodiesterase class I)